MEEYSTDYSATWHRKKYASDESHREKTLKRNSEWLKNNRDKKNEYLRNTRRNKKQVLIGYLGGKCVGCGCTENLQFDHIDRTKKEFSITKKLDWTLERIKPEVDKCQLLCKECHRIKSRVHYDHQELLKNCNLKSIEIVGKEIIIKYDIIEQ